MDLSGVWQNINEILLLLATISFAYNTKNVIKTNVCEELK